MKTISFDTAETFEVLYEAMVAPTDFAVQGGQLRLMAKILDKLESIGKLKSGEDGKRGLQTISISNEDQALYPSIDFEDAEFELIKNKFDSVPWTPAGTRRALKVYDMLQAK